MINTFNGATFNSTLLKHVSGTFSATYAAAIEKNKHDLFITVVGTENVIKKTFSEFDSDVNLVADYLNSQFPDVRVIFTLSGNSYMFAVYIIATLLTKRILFPANPSESAEFILQQKERIHQKCEIFYDSPFQKFKGIGNPMVHPSSAPKHAAMNPVRDDLSDDFIYILTSGTTGKSKIVRQTEVGVLSNVEALVNHHQMQKKTIIGTSLPLFHVNALEFSFFSTLLTGGQLILWEKFDSKSIAENICGRGVQIFSATPEVLRFFSMQASPFGKSFQSIKYFVSAAAPLSTQIVRSIWELFGKRIVQGYGLSEATNFSCLLPLDLTDMEYKKLMLESKYPSVGNSLWGNTVHILDDNGNELGEKQEGEISIRGFNIMAGYLDEDLSCEYLRTGDLGYFELVDGNKFYFISGRIKESAKRFGETVPLRDIDDFILSAGLSHVDFVTVGFKNDFAGEEIGLVCKATEGAHKDWQEILVSHLKKLPPHKRPKVILLEDKNPLRGPSGKCLRAKLAAKFINYKNRSLGNLVHWGSET